MRETADYRDYGGASTSYYQLHRGISRLELRSSTVLGAAVMSIGLVGLLLACEKLIAAAWGYSLAFINDSLGLTGSVVMSKHSMAGYTVFVPYLDLHAHDASVVLLDSSFVAALLMLAGSFAISRERVPLRYLLRLISIVQMTAVVYFSLFAAGFPYTISDYIRGMMTASLCVMVLVPVVLGFTYYVVDISWPKKLLATMMIVVYIAILAPLKYGLQSVLLFHGSLLFLPVLYLIAGIPLDVFLFVALYAWAMSWEGLADERDMVPLSDNRILAQHDVEAHRATFLPRSERPPMRMRKRSLSPGGDAGPSIRPAGKGYITNKIMAAHD